MLRMEERGRKASLALDGGASWGSRWGSPQSMTLDLSTPHPQGKPTPPSFLKTDRGPGLPGLGRPGGPRPAWLPWHRLISMWPAVLGRIGFGRGTAIGRGRARAPAGGGGGVVVATSPFAVEATLARPPSFARSDANSSLQAVVSPSSCAIHCFVFFSPAGQPHAPTERQRPGGHAGDRQAGAHRPCRRWPSVAAQARGKSSCPSLP